MTHIGPTEIPTAAAVALSAAQLHVQDNGSVGIAASAPDTSGHIQQE